MSEVDRQEVERIVFYTAFRPEIIRFIAEELVTYRGVVHGLREDINLMREERRRLIDAIYSMSSDLRDIRVEISNIKEAIKKD